jgi:hypothetical protein
MAGAPERLGDRLRIRRLCCREVPMHAIDEAERGGFPERRFGASSAPASRRASSTSMSSLLAAQCSGVSLCGPTKRALTSAPAATSSPTVAAPLG